MGGKRREPKAEEAIVYGRHAALAVLQHRPDAILRVFHDEATRKIAAPLLKACAAARKPYREVGADELQRIAGTVHHEGLVVVTTPLPLVPWATFRKQLAKRGVVVALDEVGNPHNLGAILRTAAWFGAKGLLFASAERQATLSSAAVRVAQGGAEVVPCCVVPDLAVALKALAADGFAVVSADPEGGERLDRLVPPVVIVLGSEGGGVSREVRAACTKRVSIPGTGAVESLNVSVAAGILLAAAQKTAPA